MLQSLHQLMENVHGYKLTQLLGRPTIQRSRVFVRKFVGKEADRRVLEIGCGVGSYRELFGDDYTGIDINPDYIAWAQRRWSGKFYVMDAAALPFAPNSFDDAVCISTTHHLRNSDLAAMISMAVTVARRLHIIDAILPLSPKAVFKRAWFQMDRGRFARTFDQLCDIVGARARIECHEATVGPLHDVCYIQASRIDRGRPENTSGRVLLD